MCLDVLRFFVLGNMFQESSFISETFVATLTFVWFVRLMTSTVGLKVGELGEGLGATCNSKNNDKNSQQPNLLLLDYLLCSQTFCTHLSLVLLTWYSALVWLVSCVGSDVLLKMRELGELALANLASVGLDTKMDPRVLREVGAVGKCLIA